MIDPQIKEWIDGANIEMLLRKWRFARSGDPYFQGEAGKYYSEVMAKKRNEDPAAYTRASKNIGW